MSGLVVGFREEGGGLLLRGVWVGVGRGRVVGKRFEGGVLEYFRVYLCYGVGIF